MKRRKLLAKEEQVVLAYREGAALREIAKLHDVSVGTITRVLEDFKEPRRKRGRPKKG